MGKNITAMGTRQVCLVTLVVTDQINCIMYSYITVMIVFLYIEIHIVIKLWDFSVCFLPSYLQVGFTTNKYK